MAPLTRSEARLLGQIDFPKLGKSNRNRKKKKAKRKGNFQAVKQENTVSPITYVDPCKDELYGNTR